MYQHIQDSQNAKLVVRKYWFLRLGSPFIKNWIHHESLLSFWYYAHELFLPFLCWEELHMSVRQKYAIYTKIFAQSKQRTCGRTSGGI